MRIETKHSIDDIVYVCSGNKIKKCSITKIICEVQSNGAVFVSYILTDRYGITLQRDDDKVFDTVKELVESFDL